MALNNTETMVCLFHDLGTAKAAVEDLQQAGIPESAVLVIGEDQQGADHAVDALEKSELASLGMPDKDYDHLKQGLADGGIVLAAKGTGDAILVVENIYARHSAKLIDDVTNRLHEDLSAQPTVRVYRRTGDSL